MSDENNQLILVCGQSATGKTASLRNIKNQEKWYYLNTEAGKRPSFPAKFQQYRVTDPEQIIEAFDHGLTDTNCSGIVIDSLTFLMEMYESQCVLTAANTMKAWSNYNQYFKTILQDKVIKFGKPVIFIAHTQDYYSESEMVTKTVVPIKGALKGTGIEAYFSCVVSAKTIPVTILEKYPSKLLHITEEDKLLGYKYVFQVTKTKDTVNERIRSPMGLFNIKEPYMDNDCQILLDHLNKYYGVK